MSDRVPTPSTQPDLDVSIVLAVHDEVGHLAQEVTRIREGMDESGHRYEVIVVDDGSTDGSRELAESIPGIRIIAFPENRGLGSARRAGTAAARGAVTVWTDVDMTYPNHTIPSLVTALDGHHQVIGARTSEHGTLKPFRIATKWVIRNVAGYLSRSRIPDLNSGFRAFRTDLRNLFLDDLPDGFSCDTTMTLWFLAHGYSVEYVPITYAPRAGRSKFRWWSDTRRYVVQVVRLGARYYPWRVVQAALLVIGALAIVGTVGVSGARTEGLPKATSRRQRR